MTVSRRVPSHYGDLETTYRALPIVTKAVAAYVGTLVDPRHGWLPLRGQTVVKAIRTNSAGTATSAEMRILGCRLATLLTEGVLVRCSVGDDEQGDITTDAGAKVPLSPWVENPAGDWVVLANWVPRKHRMTNDEIHAWHQARRERMAADPIASLELVTQSQAS